MPSSFSNNRRSSFSLKPPVKNIEPTGWRPDDESYWTNTGQRLKSILNLGKELVQGTARSVGSVAATTSQTLDSLLNSEGSLLSKERWSGGKNSVEVPSVLKPLFGKEAVPSISRRIAEGEIKATEMGIPSAPQGYKSPALWVAAPVIGAMTALDFTPLGGEKKALEQLAKETTEEGIIKLLDKMEIYADKNLVTSLKDAKTTDAVSGILKQRSIDALNTKIKNLKTLVANDPFDNVAAQQLIKAENELRTLQGTKVRPTAKPKETKPAEPELLPEPQPSLKLEPKILETIPSDAKIVDSLVDDITKMETRQGARQVINVERLAISDAGKAIVQGEADLLKPRIEALVGDTLTNDEVIKLAKETGEIMAETIGREQTAAYEAAILNARRRMATAAEEGTVTKEFMDDMLVVKSQGANAARIVQSFNIPAKPGAKFSAQETMVKAVMDLGKSADEIIEASKGIDFNNAQQAAEFYRKFISPKIQEWIDVLRYNSMLSSPITHLKNIFSNLLNSTIRPVLEKAMLGGIDLLSSKLTGKDRTMFAGEAGKYVAGYLKNFRSAVDKFADVWKGTAPMTNLDIKYIPLATKGKKAVLERTLKIPVRILEASDQFFQTLSRGGEVESLLYRQGKTGKTFDIQQIADDAAQYGLFRQGLHPQGQGALLNAVDEVTGTIMRLRDSKNPLVSQISKFTVPFIQTPMNLLKQGIEFTPGLGYATMIGSADKSTQFVRATIGLGLGIAGGTLIASNRLTWREPETTAEKNKYRANGMQPYSIKLGDKWVQYQYLPPFLSYPLATMALVDDMIKTKKIDEDMGTTILSGFAKFGGFIADQSYFKSIGDLMDAALGDEYAYSRLVGNVPQQLVPFRALGGWMARLVDDTQRTLEPKASFIEKQMQLLMMNIPGLSDNLPARKSPTGRPIKNTNNIFNSFSPFKIQTQTKGQERAQKISEREARIRRNKKSRGVTNRGSF